MPTCPFCGHRNIEGADVCDDCQEPLEFLTRPTPHNDLERSVLNARVFMLAPRLPIVVSPQTTVEEVLDLLVSHSIGCVVVVENDEVVGIFSERDAICRLGTDLLAFEDRPVAEFMTPMVETIDRDAKLAFALQKMDVGGYRHLPVTSDGRICGVISIRDVLDYVTANLLATAE
jgi:CBS domain-containing protein